MKAILMSVHAKWCALMMNGKKKVEVRKGTALYKAIQKLIDEYGYADIYVYCTKKEELFYDLVCGKRFYFNLPNRNKNKVYRLSNGMVVFKFRCYKVEELFIKYGVGWQTKTIKGKEQIEKLTQLSVFQLFEYCGRKTSTAIHISDLEVFDKPKELSEFEHYNLTEKSYRRFPHCDFNLTKAPQSWQWIEVGE